MPTSVIEGFVGKLRIIAPLADEVTPDCRIVGNPWVVNSFGEIFHWLNPGWKLLPGRARDIGVGASGSWIIGTNAIAGGYGIYRWIGTNWSAVPGGALEVKWDKIGEVLLGGPAEIVFTGEWSR